VNYVNLDYSHVRAKPHTIQTLQVLIKTSNNVCWVPIYLRGRTGFKKAVLAKLKSVWLHGNTDGEINLLMFWLRKAGELYEFKKAIGAKLIFKYRVQFITDLEFHLNYVNKASMFLSVAENDLHGVPGKSYFK